MLKIKTLLCVAVLAVSALSASAENIVHTVARGETLESIASRYHTTVDAIREANPNLDDMLYTGLKITVPVGAESAVSVDAPVSSDYDDTNVGVSDIAVIEAVSESEDSSLWTCLNEVGYGFTNPDDSYALNFSVGVNYRIWEELYVGARLGYRVCGCNGLYSDGRGSADTVDVTMHMLEIPVEIGYSIVTKDRRWGIAPFVGFDFDMGLTGKQKHKAYSNGAVNDDSKDMDIGGKFGIGMRLGVRGCIYGFNIGASYHLLFNDNQKGFFGDKAYPEISIGYSMYL